jgi:hypothetical protein
LQAENAERRTAKMSLGLLYMVVPRGVREVAFYTLGLGKSQSFTSGSLALSIL